MSNIYLKNILKTIAISFFLAFVYIHSKTSRDALDNIYTILSSQNNTQYMILDGIVRNLHYSIPHKPWEYIEKSDGSGLTLPMCKECYNLLQEMDMLTKPVEIILKERYDELIEKEHMLSELLQPQPLCEP